MVCEWAIAFCSQYHGQLCAGSTGPSPACTWVRLPMKPPPSRQDRPTITAREKKQGRGRIQSQRRIAPMNGKLFLRGCLWVPRPLRRNRKLLAPPFGLGRLLRTKASDLFLQAKAFLKKTASLFFAPAFPIDFRQMKTKH